MGVKLFPAPAQDLFLRSFKAWTFTVGAVAGHGIESIG